jgi:hypothetical protein
VIDVFVVGKVPLMRFGLEEVQGDGVQVGCGGHS